MKIAGFCDFCVPYNKNVKQMISVLLELIEVGYKNVAIEQIYVYKESKATDPKEDKKADPVPLPIDLSSLSKDIDNKLNLFNRLTVIYSDPAISFAMNKSHNFKKFHLVAGLPTTEAALQHACQSFTIDIITYNSETHRLRHNRKNYYMAVSRNVFFEIKYSPTISDSSERRATISKAQQYHMVGKSKHILLTSGVENKFQVRSPYDVSNLGLIFGLSEEQAKNSVLSLGRKLLQSAECRRLGKSPVLLRFTELETSEEESGNESQDSEMSVDEDSSIKRLLTSPANASNKNIKKFKLN